MTLSIQTEKIFPAHPNFEKLLGDLRDHRNSDSNKLVLSAFKVLVENNEDKKTNYNKNLIDSIIESARIAVREVGLGRTSIISLFLHYAFRDSEINQKKILQEYGETVTLIFEGLNKVASLDEKSTFSQAENFRRLLLNMARDVRVILIRLAEQTALMREMENMSADDQLHIASEASYLYAPLAHRLGLYLIKSEMEDLSLKYTNYDTYSLIAGKLDKTMKARKHFIANFIAPIKAELESQGLEFEIKGRPKSIYSIWNKMKKKEVDFEDIYDLFAIRIILHTEQKNEKADCWKVYSTVTDLFQPNPLRMRDWISVPKTNGYESLHTTVIGPGGIWVEVQIRTQRMNEIAEMGVAAHWKYKGLESEQGLDEWLAKIRDILETPETNASNFIDDFKLSLYSKEIFVFTPKGDLRKFPESATVLDFAYDIHSDVGGTCTGARVNGKSVPIRFKLQNGDKVEIFTSKTQKPNLDWLNFVVTSKAQKKIRQQLNEEKVKEAENGKEIVKRRFKNWKIEYSDEVIRSLLKQYKLPNAQEFYGLVYNEKIELSGIKDFLLKEVEIPLVESIIPSEPETVKKNYAGHESTDNFLTIDEQLANVDYKLAKCCSPIMGDSIFGFVTISEGIKIHRSNCPNAVQLIGKFGYRVVNAQWTRKGANSVFPAEIIISGEDQTGILTRITETIAKDLKISVRSINLKASNGIFNGTLSLNVKDLDHLDTLLKRLTLIKGIYSVRRAEAL